MKKNQINEKSWNPGYSSLVICKNNEGFEEFKKINFKKGELEKNVVYFLPIVNLECNFEDNQAREIKLSRVPTDFIGHREWENIYQSDLTRSLFCLKKEVIYSSLDQIESGMPIASLEQAVLMPEFPRELNILLLSLRLFKPEEIWSNCSVKLFKIKDKYFNLLTYKERLTGGNIYPIDIYKLEKKEVDIFKKFYNFIENNYGLFESNKNLKIAASFLEASYYCVPNHQKFVSLIVTLEAILSPDDRQEMTNKICQRLATLISYDERLYFYNESKKLFAMRGKIVHGVFANENKPATDETFLKIKILRTFTSFCIINYIKLLSSGLNHNNIMQLLDESVLDQHKSLFLKSKTVDTSPFFMKA